MPPPQTVEVSERQIDRTDGDFRVDISYPVLRFTPATAAARLNADIAAFVRADARYTRDHVGFHEASCTAWVATSQLLDVECQIMVDLHTRREIAEGTGGSPGDYSRAAMRVWLLPDLPAVDILELLGDPTIVGACAPLLTTGAYRLDPAGLVWELRFGSEPADEPPPGCEIEGGLGYAEMKPRSPRARAFITGMLAASGLEPDDGD